ncbi:MAG: ATP-binding protein [Verrucomicrobiota bacterium]|jgi:two-component system phosphate regulon sensor histidine kinase PhoR
MWWYLAIILAAAALLWVQRQWLERRHREDLARAGRQWAETAGRQQSELEVRAQERQQTLFNSMIEGVLLLDSGGRVLLANESLRRGFGLAADLQGRTIMEVFRWHELAALSERLPREKNISEAELEIQRGERRFWLVSAALVGGRDGGPQGQLFVFHDVTRLKELESLRKEFVGNVSHELRTPLSLIKGFAQTLLDGAKDDPEQATRFLQKIDKHSDRLLFLIEDILAISRLESGQIALNIQPVSLRELAQRVLDDLGARAAARKTALVNNIPKEILVWADADRLQQVFFNLTENAIKYGRGEGRAALSARETRDQKVEVVVADDGPGIPPEAIGRVFERFYRVDRARSRESGGTGLGLAIVKHIVQAHGGEAWVRSEPGAGAAFYFTLPKHAHPPK